MITLLQRYSTNDIVESIRYLLTESSHSEAVRRLAVEIAAGQDDVISAVHSWVRSNIAYIPDPNLPNGTIEMFISPDRMARDYYEGKALGGDCDDMAIMVTSLCLNLGMDARVVLLGFGPLGLDHAVSEVYSDDIGDYLMVDASSDFPPGWTESYARKIIV